MTVKRYEVTHCHCDAEMTAKPDGTYVTYSDHQKLVAENARLIALAKGWASAVDDCYFEQHGDIYTDSIDACNEELSTIAINTDAAIAEIKAQGVDELIADRKYEWMVSYCEDAEEFAANLRAGRKG